MANPPHEPTMEEILASIRKIISEDSSTPASADAVAPSEPRTEEPEVLELTQAVNDTHPQPPSAPAVEADSAPADTTPPEHRGDARESVRPDSPERDSFEATVQEGFFSEKTRQALNDAMSGLDAPAPVEPVSEPAVPPLGVSVEAVFERAVRESFAPVLQKWLSDNSGTLVDRMTPTIRDWLDEHFPPMLEEAVRAELARAAKLRARR